MFRLKVSIKGTEKHVLMKMVPFIMVELMKENGCITSVMSKEIVNECDEIFWAEYIIQPDNITKAIDTLELMATTRVVRTYWPVEYETLILRGTSYSLAMEPDEDPKLLEMAQIVSGLSETLCLNRNASMYMADRLGTVEKQMGELIRSNNTTVQKMMTLETYLYESIGIQNILPVIQEISNRFVEMGGEAIIHNVVTPKDQLH